jgi:hypothetical protein
MEYSLLLLRGEQLSRGILSSILAAIDGFVSGDGNIAELQSQLEANSSALDRTYEPLTREINALDADLEEIQFTMLSDEQRPAVILKLESIREAVISALDRCEH